MVRPRVHEGSLYMDAQKSETAPLRMLARKFVATIDVQLVNPAQEAEFAPPSACSKNGCAGRLKLVAVAALLTGQKMFAQALANVWPPSVIMVGTASRLIS